MKRAAAPLRMLARPAASWFSATLVVFAPLVLGGCAAQKKSAIPWTTAVQVRPVVPVAETAGAEGGEVPDIQPEIPAPAALAIARSSPAKPHIATPPASRENSGEKLEVPQIVPELSAQESNALQQETQQNLDRAERNIGAASQRTLNAAQTDLSSEVRSFIADAREAGKAGDWARARDLAKKAQVLSEELFDSL